MRAHPIEVPDLQHIVVVGASLAGLRAAEALRDAGYDATLTLVGAERRLPYDRPPLSKQVLSGDWDAERAELRDRAHYEALDLDLRLGRTATALDLAARAVELDGGASVSFDALIVATGAAPRVLPATPDLEGIHTLRTLEDCLAIRRAFDDGGRVAVVGAGFIGSEVAATARGRGLDVTLIEASPVPLVRAVGEEMGRVCAALHDDHGVDLRLGAAVEGFEGSGRVGASAAQRRHGRGRRRRGRRRGGCPQHRLAGVLRPGPARWRGVRRDLRHQRARRVRGG